MKPIILLSGPVGAGKSAIARELVARAPGPTVCIEGDTFWFFIVKSGPGPGRHKDFQTVMRAMTAAAVPYALAGFEVILDFSIPPWFLETARRIARSREVSLDFVVLRPSEAVCAARAVARAEGTITDYAYYHDLYLSFDEAAAHTIQDDEADAATLAARIREGLDAGKFRVVT